MNRTFKRLALPVGAAAALSTAGFAFMASNTVAASSAGEGQADVTGYTVSGVNYSAQQGWESPSSPTFNQYKVSAVKFILTSNASGGPANGMPANVNASLLGTAAHTSECVISGWTINGSGQGTGPVVCTFGNGHPGVSDPPLQSQVTGLDVTANQ
jgi:hypothetical protein